MIVLDHIAVGAASLEEGVAHVEDALGLTPGPGGKHARFGTHNRLMGLAEGLYLEVIAPDPEAAPVPFRWFGLDDWHGPPRLAGWICRAPLARAPAVAGEIHTLMRGDNRWRIAVPPGGGLPLGGAYPMLIEWITAPVGPRLQPSGAALRALRVEAPQAGAALALDAPPPMVTLVPGPAFRMEAVFDTPLGERLLT